MQKQYTSTIYLFEGKKTLLHFHKKMGKWAPPGGHVEENETPAEAALREAKEETGLDVAFLDQENIWFDGHSFVRPYMNWVLPSGDHQHIDFVYRGRPIGGNLHPDFRWYSHEQLGALDLFPETRQILVHLFHLL